MRVQVISALALLCSASVAAQQSSKLPTAGVTDTPRSPGSFQWVRSGGIDATLSGVAGGSNTPPPLPSGGGNVPPPPSGGSAGGGGTTSTNPPPPTVPPFDVSGLAGTYTVAYSSGSTATAGIAIRIGADGKWRVLSPVVAGTTAITPLNVRSGTWAPNGMTAASDYEVLLASTISTRKTGAALAGCARIATSNLFASSQLASNYASSIRTCATGNCKFDASAASPTPLTLPEGGQVVVSLSADATTGDPFGSVGGMGLSAPQALRLPGDPGDPGGIIPPPPDPGPGATCADGTTLVSDVQATLTIRHIPTGVTSSAPITLRVSVQTP